MTMTMRGKILCGLALIAVLVSASGCAQVAARSVPVLARGPVGKFVGKVAEELLVQAVVAGAGWAVHHYSGDNLPNAPAYRDPGTGEGLFVAPPRQSGGSPDMIYVGPTDCRVRLAQRAWQAIASTAADLQNGSDDIPAQDKATTRGYLLPTCGATSGTDKNGPWVRYGTRRGAVTIRYDEASNTERVTIHPLRSTWSYHVDSATPGWLAAKPGTYTEDDESTPAPTTPTDEQTTPGETTESPTPGDSSPPTDDVLGTPTDSPPTDQLPSDAPTPSEPPVTPLPG